MRKSGIEKNRELSDANVRLQVFQEVTEAVHSTLNLENVFKRITYGFVHSMGYTTTFIATLNKGKKQFEVKAFSTKKRLLPKIDKILGFSLRNLSFAADPELCPGIRTILEDKVMVAKTLVEVAYPFINKKACSILQQLGGSKNCIVVPLKIEKEVVGGIVITSSQEEISEEELEMIKSFAHVASNAIRNAQLHILTKQAEETLKSEKDKLQALMDGLARTEIGIDIVGMDYKILFQNQTLREKFSDLTGKLCYENYMGLEKPCDYCPMIKAIKSNKVKTVELTAANGRNYKLFSAPLPNPDGTVDRAIEVVLDITSRKRAEERLQIEKARLDQLFESALEGIVMVDKDGRVMRVNSEFVRMFGYAADEVQGRFVDELVVPKVELNKGVSITKKVSRGKNIAFEASRQRKDGTLIDVSVLASPIIVNGKVVASYAIYRDITERKKAEKVQTSIYKISEAAHVAENLEELYRLIHNTIMELMPAKNNFYIALYDADSERLNFPYFVDEYEKNPGPQKLGKGLTEYILRTGKPLLASPEVFDKLEKKGDVESVGPPSIDWLGVPLKTKDRTIGVLTVQSYTEGVRYSEEDKNILTFISEQVAMVIERKRAEEQIKASLEEKEVMFREIHHRVKNNMQIISSLLRLQSRQIKDKKILDCFNVSQNRIRSMVLIHESLYQSKDLARINFSDYINRLTIHLFSIYRTGIKSIDLKVEVGDVFLDINRAIPCGLIINELVSNSLKHAFPDGKKGKIAVKMNEDKRGNYTLIVRDTGIGFPEGVDYHKTETLGMQLVTDLVSQLNGNIKLTRLRGTEFRIVF